jgi:MOSC domain-containing protein YiiM
MAEIHSINISAAKGERKKPVSRAELKAGYGIAGDGHAGAWHRQVSLLAFESVKSMRDKGLEVRPGDFAENLTTAGINLLEIPIGARLKVGPAILEITQHGKECHEPCDIYRRAGDCVMPREGVFAVVVEGGLVKAGDQVILLANEKKSPARERGIGMRSTIGGSS